MHGAPRLIRAVARLPAGDPAPADGALPAEALAGVGTRPFGFYVHVPFCASRCGYCDFNTYVPGERGRRAGRRLRRRRARRDRPRGAGARRGGPARGHGVLRRRHAVAAVRRRADPDPAADRRALRLGGRRRGHDRGQPRVGRSRRSWRRCARPASRASRWGCRARCRACWRRSSACTPPAARSRPSPRRAPRASSRSAST